MKTLKQDLGKVSVTCNGVWDAGRNYDRLCIVNDGNFASYISKKFAPEGILLSNEEYWQPIASLRDDIKIDYDKFKKEWIQMLAEIQLKLKASRIVVENDIERESLSWLQVAAGCEVYVKDTKLSWILESIVPVINYKEWRLESDSKIDSVPTYELTGEFENLIADRTIADRWGHIIDEYYVTRDMVTNFIIETVRKYIHEAAILPGSIKPEDLSQAVLDLIGYGQITNLADEEDLTDYTNANGTHVLRFKDKVYNEADGSGLGRVYLRKNKVQGVNTLVQQMIGKPNTIYIIQYDYSLNGQTITIPENCVLQFEGGSINNGTLTGTMSLIDNKNNATIFNNISITGTYNCTEVCSDWFKKSMTDDTENLQSLMTLIPNGGKCIITEGDYNVSQPQAGDGLCINIPSNTHLIINGNIKMITNNYIRYNILSAINKHHIIIEGSGSIIGDADTHDFIEGSTSEWGYGIRVSYSNNIQIRGLLIYNCIGDGICCGHVSNIYIEDCKIHDCGRQGITLATTSNSIVDNCNIYNIRRTAPMSCIDIEPDPQQGDTDTITIKNCIFKNAVSSVSVYTPTGSTGKNIEITNCTSTLTNDTDFAFISNNSSYITYKNNNIEYEGGTNNTATAFKLETSNNILIDNCNISSGFIYPFRTNKTNNIHISSLNSKALNTCQFFYGDGLTIKNSLFSNRTGRILEVGTFNKITIDNNTILLDGENDYTPANNPIIIKKYSVSDNPNKSVLIKNNKISHKDYKNASTIIAININDSEEVVIDSNIIYEETITTTAFSVYCNNVNSTNISNNIIGSSLGIALLNSENIIGNNNISVLSSNIQTFYYIDTTCNRCLFSLYHSGFKRLVYINEFGVSNEDGTDFSKVRFVTSNISLNFANTIYKIVSDIDLQGETLTIPEGCTLDFQGGSFSNGTIIGNDTKIINNLSYIFKNVEIQGVWNVSEVYPEWFGAKGDGVTDDTISLQMALDFPVKSYRTVCLLDRVYLIGTRYGDLNVMLFINSNTTILSNTFGTIKVADHLVDSGVEGEHYYTIIGPKNEDISYIENVTIKNLIFDHNGSNNLLSIWTSRNNAIRILKGNNIEIINCEFKDNTGLQYIVLGDNTDVGIGECKILNCDFSNSGASILGNTENKDHSSIYYNGTGILISNCNFINRPFSELPKSPGNCAIELHGGYNNVSSCKIINYTNSIIIAPTTGCKSPIAKIDNCIISGHFGVNIWSYGDYDLEEVDLTNSYIELIGGWGQVITTNKSISPFKRLVLDGCTIARRGPNQNNTYCMGVDAAENVIISNNNFVDCITGAFRNTNRADFPNFKVFINNNKFSGTVTESFIYISNVANQNVCDYFELKDNYFEGSAVRGDIYIPTVNGGLIENNTFNTISEKNINNSSTSKILVFGKFNNIDFFKDNRSKVINNNRSYIGFSNKVVVEEPITLLGKYENSIVLNEANNYEFTTEMINIPLAINIDTMNIHAHSSTDSNFIIYPKLNNTTSFSIKISQYNKNEYSGNIVIRYSITGYKVYAQET